MITYNQKIVCLSRWESLQNCAQIFYATLSLKLSQDLGLYRADKIATVRIAYDAIKSNACRISIMGAASLGQPSSLTTPTFASPPAGWLSLASGD
jgi:hypothetical protein